MAASFVATAAAGSALALASMGESADEATLSTRSVQPTAERIAAAAIGDGRWIWRGIGFTRATLPVTPIVSTA
jgi:hypothetical protein